MNVDQLARAEHAWTEWKGNKAVEFGDPLCECLERAEFVSAEYEWATFPATETAEQLHSRPHHDCNPPCAEHRG